MEKSSSQEKNTLAFTDGSSLGNPGPGGWGALIVFHDGVVTELGGREEKTTNNKMELQALVSLFAELKKRKESGAVKIFMDSRYVQNGITKWVYGWEKNRWMTKGKTEVLNKKLWQAGLALKKEIEKKHEINFFHVPGHVGHPGNERVDTIARSFAEGERVELYEGELEKYFLTQNDLEMDPEGLKEAVQKKARSKKKAYSYVSLVDGALQFHKTWTECKARVKGKRGAKFKKAISKEDEENILKDWGVER